MKCARSGWFQWVVAILVALGAAVPVRAGSFVWKFPGRENTVFLVGSVHFLLEGADALPGEVEEAYRRAGKVVFETDLGILESESFAGRMDRASRLPVGIQLPQVLTADTYGKLCRVAENMGIPVEGFYDRQPSVVAIALLVAHLQRLGIAAESGVDAQLWSRTRIEGKSVGALETPEFQLQLMTSLPLPLQEQLLRQTIEEMEILSADLSELLEQWRAGDVTGVGALLSQSFREYPELQQTFIDQRNLRWIPQIEALAGQPEDVLVVMGAGHLLGSRGVVELLRTKGYPVEMCPASPAHAAQ